jgi:AraC-like DNA-binding protein
MHTKNSFFTAFQIVISVVILFFSLSLNAQTDSLQGKSYDELIKLFESSKYKDANDAKTYAIAANRIAKKENNQEKIGWSIYYIANANSYIFFYQEALLGIDTSIAIAEELKNNLLLFKNHNLRGNILSEIKKEFEALDEYKIAKKYAHLTDDPLDEIVVSINIAFMKKTHRDHKRAITLFKENLELLQNVKTHSTKKDTYEKQVLFNLADTYLRIKNPKEAAKYNTVALEKCNEQESPMFYHSLLMNDAIINYQTKNYEKTIEISKKAENYFLSINNEGQLITPYFYIGISYFQQKKYRDAIHYLEKTNDIIHRKNTAYNYQKEGYEILYKCYNQIGDSKNATKNLDIYLELDKKTDSINIQVNNKIHKEHDIIPLQNEITSLNSDKKKQEKKTTYLYVVSTMLVLLLGGLFLYYKKRELKKEKRFQELLLTYPQKQGNNTQINQKKTNKDSIVKKDTQELILQALNSFEDQQQFLNKNLTLGKLAKKIKTNPKYLSSVINEFKEKSFPQYINDLRIDYIVDLLYTNKIYRKYSIKAIANEIGFRNTTSFSKAFHRKLGLQPSYYIKKLNKLED